MNVQLTKFLYILRKKQIIVTVLAILAVLLAVLGVLALTDPYGCRMADNVTVGGVEVGGMFPWEAGSALKAAAKPLLEQELTVRLPEETLVFQPKDLKLDIATGTLVRAAWQAGRGSQQTSIPLTQGLRWNEREILARLQGYAAQYDTTLSPSSYHLEGKPPKLNTGSFDPGIPAQTLHLNPGTPECHLNIPALMEQMWNLYTEGFLAETLELSHTPEPTLLPEALDLDAIWQELCTEAADDSLDMETYEFVQGTYGYGFDREAAAAALLEKPWGQTISLPMVITAPEILGDAVYFRDVLGTCDTKHTDDENRNTNLRLMCQALNGTILQPGEEFSYNGTVGERTEAKGYKPAGAYSGNRLVKDIGGGVCQGSTTLYNCALLADLEILERNGHGFTVNYVPIGLDAAVNWSTKTDLRFRNNWNFPILIEAQVSDGYVRMRLLGTDEKDYYVKMTSGYSEEELRIYANSYKYKYDKQTGQQISKELEARSSYMYMN